MQLDCKTPKPGIEAACLSDVGLQRSDNEDSYLYWEPDSDEDFRRKGRLAIVADGMGGYEGGQEASLPSFTAWARRVLPWPSWAGNSISPMSATAGFIGFTMAPFHG
jgi:serine/threonine protein phosphatase PrpC